MKSFMHQSFVTTVRARPPPHTYGNERGVTGLMCCGQWPFEFPRRVSVTRACDVTQIYPHGIYYYKEQGYAPQQVPAVQGF